MTRGDSEIMEPARQTTANASPNQATYLAKVKRLLGPEYLTFKIRSIEDLKELKKLMSDDFYCGLELVNRV